MVLPWKGSVGVKAYREFESPRFRTLRLAAGGPTQSGVNRLREVAPPHRGCTDRPVAISRVGEQGMAEGGYLDGVLPDDPSMAKSVSLGWASPAHGR